MIHGALCIVFTCQTHVLSSQDMGMDREHYIYHVEMNFGFISSAKFRYGQHLWLSGDKRVRSWWDYQGDLSSEQMTSAEHHKSLSLSCDNYYSFSTSQVEMPGHVDGHEDAQCPKEVSIALNWYCTDMVLIWGSSDYLGPPLGINSYWKASHTLKISSSPPC